MQKPRLLYLRFDLQYQYNEEDVRFATKTLLAELQINHAFIGNESILTYRI